MIGVGASLRLVGTCGRRWQRPARRFAAAPDEPVAEARSVLASDNWCSRTGKALRTRLIAAGFAQPTPPLGLGPDLSQVSVVIPVRDRPAGTAPADHRARSGARDHRGGRRFRLPLDDATLRHESRWVRPRRATPESRGLPGLSSRWWTPTSYRQTDGSTTCCRTSPIRRSAPSRRASLPPAADRRDAIDRTLARYDAARSPLDLGSQPSLVIPGSRVSYVPAAALVLRGSALGDNPRVFDEELRYGEDVDLVWRLVAAGWTVRYEPAAAVGHAHRATPARRRAQRFGYGFSAASLAARHPGKLAPFAGNRWTVAAWALAGRGPPDPRRCDACRRRHQDLPHAAGPPSPSAGRRGWWSRILASGRVIGEALTRPYGPLALPLLLTVARCADPAADRARCPRASGDAEYVRKRPDLDPVRWFALRTGDDLAYGAGVWAGCLRARNFAALRPRLTGG